MTVTESCGFPLTRLSRAGAIAEQMRLISRVANLAREGRMILLVDPTQLLDQVEADVLAKFDRDGLQHGLKAS